jgi:hypothetical protein
MKTDVWGKHLWYSIHLIALSYPADPTNEEKRHYQSFFENLHQVLPCYKCSINYLTHLNKIPITASVLENAESLFRWTIDMHNLVNLELSKKQWSYGEATDFYENFEQNSKCNKTTKEHKKLKYFLIFVILAIVLCFVVLNSERLLSLYQKSALKTT